MMTTTKTFGIKRPDFQPPAPQTNSENKDDSKFQLLSMALEKYFNNEITKDQLQNIQKTLK